jgi:maltose alpha-D-glucosyltransferase/alpha-amylase
MGRFLTERSPCAAVMPTAGAVELVGPDGMPTTLVLLQGAVANQGDGWRFTLQYLERAIDEAATQAGEGGTAAAVEHEGFLMLVRALAARTAELHRALAVTTGDPAFDPEPLDGAHLGAWARRIALELDTTLTLLRAQAPGLPDAARAAAERALARGAALNAEIDGLARGLSGGVPAVRTRYHGDLHLGQVLMTRNDWVITDLEGEPARSLDERREKATPLKDVAGMLRSFAYAAAVAARDTAAARPDAPDGAAIRWMLGDWRARACREYLGAYRETLAGSSALPAADEALQRLLRLATLERLLYEIRYELKNRPDWVGVPLDDLAS